MGAMGWEIWSVFGVLALTLLLFVTDWLPTGHPAPLLVQGPGAYRTGDYARFGLGLALLTLAAIALIIPMKWPLDG